MSNTIAQKELPILLADIVTLYFKSLNYHWHVRGPNFMSLHALFETLYTSHAAQIDMLAERIRALGLNAPAGLEEFVKLRRAKDGDSKKAAKEMLDDLMHDNRMIVKEMQEILRHAERAGDTSTTDMLTDFISEFDKQHWMLQAHTA